MTKTEALAWAAGFIDGEGSFSRQVNHRKQPVGVILRVGQAEPTTLVKLQKALGGGAICGPYPNSSPLSKKLRWEYKLSRQGLQAIIRELWPYLSNPKRRQYNEVVALVKRMRYDADAAEAALNEEENED